MSPSANKTADTSRVRRLTLDDVPKAALTLYQSFTEDALAQLLTSHIKDAALKREADLQLYRSYLAQHIAKGLCLGIGENEHEFETVAMWSLPSSGSDGLDSFATLMEAGYGRLWDLVGKEGHTKIFKGMLPLLHHTFEHVMATDARFQGKGVYTLVYLGSVQRARGKGNVRAIFEYMFDKYIDVPGNNNIAYLESSSRDNIPIYGKFGFHFYKDIMLGANDGASAQEGRDYAIMNVMIRGTNGETWDSTGEAKL